MSNWYSIIIGILILGLIITFHEFGHFIVAKINRINVTEFMVGMGPVLFEKKKNGTRYTLRLIPFGGACIMQGNEAIPGMEEGEERSLPEEGSFLSKNVWQRIAVIFAGPFFNFILAFIISVIVLGFAGVDKPVLSAILKDLPAESAGLKAGDEVISINGKRMYLSGDITLYMHDYVPGTEVDLVVKRDGEELSFHITPEYSEEYQKYMLGISWGAYREKMGPLGTMKYSIIEVGYWIRLTIKSLGMLFTGKASVNDLSGPVGIVDIVDDTVEAAKEDGAFYVFLNVMNLVILLSANVGIMNLLPIPALDGGKLLFLFIEAVRGKPIDKKKEGYVHLAGVIFLLLLMVFIVFNDFRKMIFGV